MPTSRWKQADGHANLLKILAEAAAAFQWDITRGGLAERVLIMTFSEFGRRVAQNGSDGTDHGSAAPMFLVGSGVKGGVFGAAPNLTELVDDGNLKFTVDFRAVYGAILDRWLGGKSEAVLGARFPPLEFLPD